MQWCYRRILKISWKDRGSNEQVLHTERENLFAKSNNETNNNKQHNIHWQAAREA